MAKRMTILLADDDPEEVELLKLHLQDAGFPHDFEPVPDGKDVVERLEAGARGERALPDLVVMDLRMPRVSGDEVLARIGKDPRFAKVPLVIMSNSGNDSDERRCLELGAKLYLVKPTSQAEYELIARRLGDLL